MSDVALMSALDIMRTMNMKIMLVRIIAAYLPFRYCRSDRTPKKKSQKRDVKVLRKKYLIKSMRIFKDK
jgi:hypothetical protein